MTLKEFQHRLDDLLEAAERDELPPAELLLMLDEAAEMQRGDVFRHEDPRIGRHERMPPGVTQDRRGEGEDDRA